MRVRVVLLVLLICAMLPPLSMSAQAPSPTAVVVIPPTSEGCDEIGDYLGGLKATDDALLVKWAAAFPGTTYWNNMTDGQRNSFLVGLTPDEMKAFARLYDETVEMLERIEPPPVAAEYHQTRIEWVKVAANAFRDAATMGVFTSLLLYNDQLEGLQALQEAQGKAAVSVCPAFQSVIDYQN